MPSKLSVVKELLLIMNGLIARMFIDGTATVYYMANNNDPTIDQLNCLSCNSSRPASNGTLVPIYTCFSTDKLAGYLTMLCIFIPGLLMVGFMYTF